MNRLALATSTFALFSGATTAETIGVSIVNFDNSCQTLRRQGIETLAAEVGLEVRTGDAQSDGVMRPDQISNFIASGVGGIVVTPVDTAAITAAVEAAGVPLVDVNLEPQYLSVLRANQVNLSSSEIVPGTSGAFEACSNLRAPWKSNGADGYIIMGWLSHRAALQSTGDVEDIVCETASGFMTGGRRTGPAKGRRT